LAFRIRPRMHTPAGELYFTINIDVMAHSRRGRDGEIFTFPLWANLFSQDLSKPCSNMTVTAGYAQQQKVYF